MLAVKNGRARDARRGSSPPAPAERGKGRIVVVVIVTTLLGAMIGFLTKPSRPAESPNPPRSSRPSAERPILSRNAPEHEPSPPQALAVRTEAPAIQYFPRAAADWQGMLVDREDRQVCSETANCGIALSCRADGKCGPCESDAECLAGEVCVLDHCVLSKLVGCRHSSECGSGRAYHCVLSGLTGNDVRGNSEMRSYCLDPKKPEHSQTLEEATAKADAVKGGRFERPPLVAGDLLSLIRNARGNPANATAD